MILSDIDLRTLLPKMNIEVEEGWPPFDTGSSIQPSSIDLRLDGVFWEPRRWGRRSPVDFMTPGGGIEQTKNYFRRKELAAGEFLTLRPGGMILARTMEKFTVPEGYSGKLEGRSTFARLGISIHCTCDFINTGWRGRMPMQLINFGPVPVRVVPGLPICQLIVTQLTQSSERPYGREGLGSKYMEDEGEPSKYWKDKRIQDLRNSYGNARVSDPAQAKINRIMESQSPEIVMRFVKFLDGQRRGNIDNAVSILERFAGKEKRSKWINEWLKAGARWACFAPVFTFLLKMYTTLLESALSIVLVIVFMIVYELVVGYYAFVKEYPTRYYEMKD